MKRLLMIVSIAALTSAGFAPAHADRPAEGTPNLVFCHGTGGYTDTNDGPVWSFSTPEPVSVPIPVGPISEVQVQYGCQVWSPGTVEYNLDDVPTDPVAFAHWATVQKLSPVGFQGSMTLEDGLGDFACGNGTLTSNVENGHSPKYFQSGVGVTIWNTTDWTATLADGSGDISGNLYRHANNFGDRQDASFDGKIVIDDGASTGDCDDSAGASTVVVVFVIE